MIRIPVQVIDGVNHPAEPFPSDALQIICDGEKYIVYQPGDEIPPPPQVEPAQEPIL